MTVKNSISALLATEIVPLPSTTSYEQLGRTPEWISNPKVCGKVCEREAKPPRYLVTPCNNLSTFSTVNQIESIEEKQG